MVTREDVESFLLRIEENVEEVEPGMWVLGSDAGRFVLHYSPPLLVLRVKILDVPEDNSRCIELFRRLLELNASDLVHGAYAIEEGDVILTDTLELEHLDFNALQSAVDSMQIALASHLESLSPFREC
ncbi:MAG: CesT family type III secretion system chaperone [Gemmatimonadota bacterium]